MKHGVFSSPAPLALLASAALLAIAGFFVFVVSDNALPLHIPSRTGSLFTFDDAAGSSHDSSNVWLWTAVTGIGLYLTFRHFLRTARRSFAQSGTVLDAPARDPIRMQAADQLRDALAIFNRQAFSGTDATDELAPLYKAFVATRIELQKRNSRFMYDAIGASHVQAAQQMLIDMEEDFSRDWPGLHKELHKLPARPTEDEVTRFQATMAGNGGPCCDGLFAPSALRGP
jgi:hypothetical protein